MGSWVYPRSFPSLVISHPPIGNNRTGKNINLPVFDGIKGYLLWALKNVEDVVKKTKITTKKTFILWGDTKTSDLVLNTD